jgi:glycosyltransferase involved in cell wall biosynthesis
MVEITNPQDTATGSGDAPGGEKPAVAIIMPLRNDARSIAATLEQIVAQDYPKDKLEVIIADDSSTDATVAIAQDFRGQLPGLQILPNEVGGPAAGRNVGVRNSTAPYIIVIDGHVHIPSTTLISDMVETFEKRKADCLCRPQPLDPPGLNMFERAVAVARRSFLGHNPDSDIYSDVEKEADPTSSGAMWRREVFEKIGEFDETLDACEDVDFNHRVKKAGLRSWLSPKLKVQYYPRDSLGGLWRQMARYGAGRYSFAKKHGQFSLMQLIAPIGFVVFVFLAILSLLGAHDPDTDVILGDLINIYVVIVGITTLILSLRAKQMEFVFSLPFIFPVIHFGLGYGFVKAFISSRMSRSKSAQTAPAAPAATGFAPLKPAEIMQPIAPQKPAKTSEPTQPPPPTPPAPPTPPPPKPPGSSTE